MNATKHTIPRRLRQMSRADWSKLILSVVFIAVVFVPLVKMLIYIDRDSIQRVITAANFRQALCNTLISSALATIITVILAFVLVMCIQRTTIRLKNFWSIAFVLPMLIPSISSGMGLVILFGNNGIITRLMNLSSSIYGLKGIVLGSVMYAFPVAFLMLSDIIQYEDGSPYEAAQVLGIPRWRRFAAITLPYLRKPLISVAFATFTMIVTDYGVPLMVGGKYTTIASVMYQEVIGQLDFGKGAVYGVLLLLPAVAAFIIDILNKDRSNAGYVTKPCKQANSAPVRGAAYTCCIITCLVIALPLMAFVLLAFTKNYPQDLSFTFENLEKALRLKAGQYWGNSVMISLLTAVLGTMVAFCTAYLTARMKSSVSNFLHLSSMTSAAVPGVVLGLAYVLTFNKTPIYGTIIILVVVNIVHFIASPYLMMYNTLSKINANLEGVAHTMGINRAYLIKDVLVPQCKSTLLEMFVYFFVNCMMTISAVSFLATTANKPVALMINQFEAQMQLECAAVVSIMILLTNLLVKGAAHIFKNKLSMHMPTRSDSAEER